MAQFDVDVIGLTFLDLTPLTDRFHRAISDLILEAEDHIAIVGLVQTTDLCLESIAGLDLESRIFATDQTIVFSLRMGEQAVSRRFAILHLGRVECLDKAPLIPICAGTGEILRLVLPA